MKCIRVDCFKVRKNSANKLFEALLMVDDVVTEENMEKVQTLLSETQWYAGSG